jgi:hypothetical protein
VPNGFHQEQKFSSLKQKYVAVCRQRQIYSPHPSREADLRAKRLAAGAEILLAQAKIHSGVERSDKFCPPHPSREARARRAARIRSRNSLGSSKNP